MSNGISLGKKCEDIITFHLGCSGLYLFVELELKLHAVWKAIVLSNPCKSREELCFKLHYRNTNREFSYHSEEAEC